MGIVSVVSESVACLRANSIHIRGRFLKQVLIMNERRPLPYLCLNVFLQTLLFLSQWLLLVVKVDRMA